VLRWLRRYVRVKKSEIEPSLYLVEPSQEDLLLFGSKPTIVSHVGESSTSGGTGMDPLTKMFKEARWGFLDNVSRVTRFTRRTAEDILDSPKVPLHF